MSVRRYTMCEFLDPETMPQEQGESASYGSQSWDCGLGYKKSLELAVSGDPSIVGKTRKAVENFTEHHGVKECLRWEPSPVGQRVCVPDYLCGSPYSMRKRVKRQAETRHVGIYVFMVAS